MSRGGIQRITADGVIGTSGKPVRLYGLHIISGATAGVIDVYSGTDATGTGVLIDVSGAANQGVNVPGFPAEGIYFPGGCYIDVDANTTAVVAQYEVVSKA